MKQIENFMPCLLASMPKLKLFIHGNQTAGKHRFGSL